MSYDPTAQKVSIDPTQWDDWQWGGSVINPPGAPSPASLSEIQVGQWAWLFVSGNVIVAPDQQIPHQYAEGTDIQPHIHFAATTTETYTGAWTLTITDWLSAANGAVRQPQTTMTAAFNGALTAHQMVSIDFSTVLTGVNRKVSSVLTAHLTLNLTAGTSLYLLGLDAHYRKNTLGSATQTAK